LQKLEQRLGLTLLERNPTGSSLTPEGSRLAPVCAEALAAMTGLVDRAEAIRAEQDVLTVAATRHIIDHFLSRWLPRTLEGVGVRLIELNTLGVARTVRAGDAMVGFTEGPTTPAGLGSAMVAAEPVAAVVGRSHPWYGTARISRRTLAQASVVLSQPGSGTRDVVEKALADRQVTAEVVEVANSSAARVAALVGTGPAFLPRCWVEPFLADGALHELPLPGGPIELPIRAVWRGRRPATGPARDLVDQLLAGD
jgi:DNA-binding transcriptional LysR family regulator